MEDPGRRVRANAAITAARAALAEPAPDNSADEVTQSLATIPAPRIGESTPESRRARRGFAPGALAAPGRPARPRLFRGAARSVFVTPWFAAATGFVIAAGMWVYSPHTVLSFPASEPGLSRCHPAGCVEPAPHKGNPNLAIAKPGVRMPGKAKRHRVTHGLVFKFTVLWHDDHGFAAMISVTGRKVPARWRLSFEIPGAQIGHVAGVSWRPNAAGDGGKASRLSWQSGDPGPGNEPGPGGNNNSWPPGGPDSPPVIAFSLMGTGPAAMPTHCVFDGASCTFK